MGGAFTIARDYSIHLNRGLKILINDQVVNGLSIVTAKSIAAVAASDLGWVVGVSGQHEVAPVSGRHVHVDHLHGGELLQHRRRRQSGRQRAQMLLECDLQAIGDEGDEDEDVRL